MRKISLVEGEFYHVFNRGVDKRRIFADQKDLNRFFKCMKMFNSVEPIGSLLEEGFKEKNAKKPLVNFVAYNLLSNHFHFILEQAAPDGISKFMHRLQGGYSWYFNHRHKRSGSLFQGTFKAVHINSNEYLLHVSAYVNLNDQIRPLGGLAAKLGQSSWGEYANSQKGICKKFILGQFRKPEEYKKFALSSLEAIRKNKEKYRELEK